VLIARHLEVTDSERREDDLLRHLLTRYDSPDPKRTGRLMTGFWLMASVTVSFQRHARHYHIAGRTLTRIPACLSNPKLAFTLVWPRRLPPEPELSAFRLVVEVSNVSPHCSEGTAVTLAIALCSPLNLSAVHAPYVHLADPLVPAVRSALDDSC
jgi:hypothetical protein